MDEQETFDQTLLEPWLLCRREEAPAQTVERAIAAGARTGQPLEAVLPMTARPPARPLALLAGRATAEGSGE